MQRECKFVESVGLHFEGQVTANSLLIDAWRSEKDRDVIVGGLNGNLAVFQLVPEGYVPTARSQGSATIREDAGLNVEPALVQPYMTAENLGTVGAMAVGDALNAGTSVLAAVTTEGELHLFVAAHVFRAEHEESGGDGEHERGRESDTKGEEEAGAQQDLGDQGDVNAPEATAVSDEQGLDGKQKDSPSLDTHSGSAHANSNNNKNNAKVEKLVDDDATALVVAPMGVIKPCWTGDVPQNANAIVIADVDGDGQVEVVMGTRNRILYVLRLSSTSGTTSPAWEGVDVQVMSTVLIDLPSQVISLGFSPDEGRVLCGMEHGITSIDIKAKELHPQEEWWTPHHKKQQQRERKTGEGGIDSAFSQEQLTVGLRNWVSVSQRSAADHDLLAVCDASGHCTVAACGPSAKEPSSFQTDAWLVDGPVMSVSVVPAHPTQAGTMVVACAWDGCTSFMAAPLPSSSSSPSSTQGDVVRFQSEETVLAFACGVMPLIYSAPTPSSSLSDLTQAPSSPSPSPSPNADQSFVDGPSHFQSPSLCLAYATLHSDLIVYYNVPPVFDSGGTAARHKRVSPVVRDLNLPVLRAYKDKLQTLLAQRVEFAMAETETG
jgi:hypothetical protein